MKIIGAVVPAAILLILGGCATTPTTLPTPTATPRAASPSPTPSPAGTVPAFEAVDPTLYFVNDLDGAAYWGEWSTQDVNFSSPDRNIGCGILGDDAAQPLLWGCAIATKDWTFPTDDPNDYCYNAQVPCGGGIEASGAELPDPRYRSDPGFPGAVVTGMPDAPIRVLEYGQSVTFNGVTCYSEETGITCEHAGSGHGFVISESRNDIR